MFTGSLYKISRLNTEVQEAIISLKRVFDLLIFYPTMDKDINNHVKDNIFDGIIIFDNVSFTYNEREEVYTLQNLSLKIQPNNITAIIGESGSGKTTIFNLLFGLFDNYTGNIYIDGVELRSIPRTILCENISYVTQDFFMITGTVKENLSLANTNAIDEDIYEACKESFIHDFIMTLPNGYNTKLGEGGIDLSQGQKQRLSIARSLLRKPHMFLFDEITSSLDNDTELIINNLIKKLSYNHTVILISHRDTCIADAHKVINIKEGRNVNMCNRLEKF